MCKTCWLFIFLDSVLIEFLNVYCLSVTDALGDQCRTNEDCHMAVSDSECIDSLNNSKVGYLKI